MAALQQGAQYSGICDEEAGSKLGNSREVFSKLAAGVREIKWGIGLGQGAK